MVAYVLGIAIKRLACKILLNICYWLEYANPMRRVNTCHSDMINMRESDRAINDPEPIS